MRYRHGLAQRCGATSRARETKSAVTTVLFQRLCLDVAKLEIDERVAYVDGVRALYDAIGDRTRAASCGPWTDTQAKLAC